MKLTPILMPQGYYMKPCSPDVLDQLSSPDTRKDPMIKPTLHRHVDYFASSTSEPQVGIICHVHDDRLVNLAVFDEFGNPILGGIHHVRLIQDEDTVSDTLHFCKFPPFVLHAARTQPPETRVNRPISGETEALQEATQDFGERQEVHKHDSVTETLANQETDVVVNERTEEPTEENTAPAKKEELQPA